MSISAVLGSIRGAANSLSGPQGEAIRRLLLAGEAYASGLEAIHGNVVEDNGAINANANRDIIRDVSAGVIGALVVEAFVLSGVGPLILAFAGLPAVPALATVALVGVAAVALAPIIEVGLDAAANWLADIFGDSLLGRDPLVFDLNGGGAQLTSLRGSDVFFDLDNNGFAERTGWVRAGDGLLALDVNGNGRIDNGSELFGTATTDGFTILSQYDSNGDNQITSADAIWDRLLIWRDGIAGGAGALGADGISADGISADGISTGAELSSLNDNGIVSINLNDRAPARNERFREGNVAAANDNFEWRMAG